MLKKIALRLKEARKKQLSFAIDLLTELERKWEFEWPHDAKHWKSYQRRKITLENQIKRLRLMLGYDAMEDVGP